VDGEDRLGDIAEALRKATEAASFIYRGDHIRVTISLGLSLAPTIRSPPCSAGLTRPFMTPSTVAVTGSLWQHVA
jgi:hypothetical protein